MIQSTLQTKPDRVSQACIKLLHFGVSRENYKNCVFIKQRLNCGADSQSFAQVLCSKLAGCLFLDTWNEIWRNGTHQELLLAEKRNWKPQGIIQKWATPHFFIYLLGKWEIGALVYFYLLNYVQTNMKVQHKKQKQTLHNSNDLENIWCDHIYSYQHSLSSLRQLSCYSLRSF